MVLCCPAPSVTHAPLALSWHALGGLEETIEKAPGMPFSLTHAGSGGIGGGGGNGGDCVTQQAGQMEHRLLKAEKVGVATRRERMRGMGGS